MQKVIRHFCSTFKIYEIKRKLFFLSSSISVQTQYKFMYTNQDKRDCSAVQ